MRPLRQRLMMVIGYPLLVLIILVLMGIPWIILLLDVFNNPSTGNIILGIFCGEVVINAIVLIIIYGLLKLIGFIATDDPDFITDKIKSIYHKIYDEEWISKSKKPQSDKVQIISIRNRNGYLVQKVDKL